MDRGNVTPLIFLDLSVAFNTIDHCILLGNFVGMGLGIAMALVFSNGQFHKVVL